MKKIIIEYSKATCQHILRITLNLVVNDLNAVTEIQSRYLLLGL